MSVQRIKAANPGQAIYDTLSDEAKAAVDALPAGVFERKGGLVAVHQLARSLETANSISGDVWSLICDRDDGRGFICLNVAMTNLVSYDAGQLKIVVRIDDSSNQQLREFASQHRTRATYSDAEMVQLKADPGTDQGGFPAYVVEAHNKEVARHASVGWRRNQRANWHRDDWRVELAMLAEKTLPAPAYVPVTLIGLPMDSADSKLAAQVAVPDTPITASDTPLHETLNTFRLSRVLRNAFASAGLTYSDSQIESFYTALQTKGFVILSGISGTGKSKIAQRFAGMLPEIQGQREVALAADSIRIAVKPYMKKYKRIRLWKEVAAALPIPAPGTSIMVPFSVDGEWGKCRVWNRPETDVDVYLFPQGDVGEQFRERISDSFALRFILDEELERIESIELLTELPIQTNSHEESGAVAVPNHLFLPVRPDWRDGKALVGYHNPLTGKYVRTGFLDFVLSAQEDFLTGNRNAFLVILDEMNLAHVEYYFADVLSVIESGRDEDGWTVEGIPLAVGDEDSDLPEVLKLPPNLYIVGTVNMDETTHPFSPKVLDRAFTIELTDVDFRAYPPEPVEVGAGPSGDERQALLDEFIGSGKRYPRIDKGEISATVERHERFRADLASLNASLRRYRMHFGYRVFDEIMQFVHNAERNGLFASANDAFDHAVLMKVLPKFNGSRAKLENPLFELVHWCNRGGVLTAAERADIEAQFVQLSDDLRPFDTIVRAESESVDDDWRYPATGRRAALMMQDLYTDGFASFG